MQVYYVSQTYAYMYTCSYIHVHIYTFIYTCVLFCLLASSFSCSLSLSPSLLLSPSLSLSHTVHICLPLPPSLFLSYSRTCTRPLACCLSWSYFGCLALSVKYLSNFLSLACSFSHTQKHKLAHARSHLISFSLSPYTIAHKLFLSFGLSLSLCLSHSQGRHY